MYTVLKYFCDLEDSGHEYFEGDAYPRQGYKPSKDRIIYLQSSKNRVRTPVISKDVGGKEKEEG